MVVASAFWRRVEAPGHDACCLRQVAEGWRLEGAAVFLDDGLPAWLTYAVACDQSWSTVWGEVRGWRGGGPVEFKVERTARGGWTLNGAAVLGLDACLDLDFGFTPATNLPQLRRIRLADGEAADVPVAWLDVAAGTLTLLPQRYERRSESSYWYEAPSVGYQGLLELDGTGFVRRYPGLWESES